MSDQDQEVKPTHNIKSLNKRLEQIERTPDVPVEELVERIDNLEQCIAKMAHFNGGANERILREFNIDPYTLKDADMRKVG